MPLPGFSESERNIITNAAEPIHPSHRGAFLEAVANALASYPVLGEGIVPAEELYRPVPVAVLDGEQVFPSRQHVSRLAGLLTMALWSAIRLQPNRERLALNELARAGYETYCPRILHRIRSNTGRKIETFPLLFPGYVFVFIVSQWWSARYAPGVIDFILDGERPARVPDKVIDELRGRERGGLVVLPEKPQLTRGPAFG